MVFHLGSLWFIQHIANGRQKSFMFQTRSGFTYLIRRTRNFITSQTAILARLWTATVASAALLPHLQTLRGYSFVNTQVVCSISLALIVATFFWRGRHFCRHILYLTIQTGLKVGNNRQYQINFDISINLIHWKHFEKYIIAIISSHMLITIKVQ